MPGPRGVAPAENNKKVYYLSLGTSLAAGVQADPLTGESVVTDVSYPSKIADALGEDIRKLRHVNLGCPGETSTTFIDGGICDYRRGSQLDEALHFLHVRGKFVGLITIDMGANDILPCFEDPDLLTCFQQQVALLVENLNEALPALREAAGPDVPIVAMNYYNPLLATWFTNPELVPLLVQLQAELNGVLGLVYAAHGIPVADVAGAFQSDDIVTDANMNGVPDSVELICAWTWMCSHGNIHANDDGYCVIANTFLSVIP